MSSLWPATSYDRWAESCDTLHAHAQVLGKLAVRLAPPEPELHHAALRLTARGWETSPLPAPNGTGAFVVALDLRMHEAVVEHSDGRRGRIPLTPHRTVGDVARDVLAAVRHLAGAVEINPAPQERPGRTAPQSGTAASIPPWRPRYLPARPAAGHADDAAMVDALLSGEPVQVTTIDEELVVASLRPSRCARCGGGWTSPRARSCRCGPAERRSGRWSLSSLHAPAVVGSPAVSP
jgi:hypothetical protein